MRNWLWPFIAIALLAFALLTWLALFVRQQLEPGQQLNLEQLHAARKLWEVKKPNTYQMVYSTSGGDKAKDHYFVDVRDNKVQTVFLNAKELLPAEQFEHHSMEGLFNTIEADLNRDAQPGSPRTFCRGYFDAEDGHLHLFVRRVAGTPERVEIKVDEFKR